MNLFIHILTGFKGLKNKDPALEGPRREKLFAVYSQNIHNQKFMTFFP